MGGLTGYVEFIKKKEEKPNVKDVPMKRSSRVELKAEKTLRTRAVAGRGGAGGCVGGGVGAWCGAQRKKLIHNSSVSRKRKEICKVLLDANYASSMGKWGSDK